MSFVFNQLRIKLFYERTYQRIMIYFRTTHATGTEILKPHLNHAPIKRAV